MADKAPTGAKKAAVKKVAGKKLASVPDITPSEGKGRVLTGIYLVGVDEDGNIEIWGREAPRAWRMMRGNAKDSMLEAQLGVLRTVVKAG